MEANDDGPVLLFDTHSLLQRAYEALPSQQTAAGTEVAALYGLCVLIIKLVRDHDPSSIAFAGDPRSNSFRKAVYAGYKASHKSPPPALKAQLKLLPELAELVGCPLHVAPGFEADDVIATLVAKLAAKKRAAVIATGDTQLLQVVHPDAKVLLVGGRGASHALFDESDVCERYRVPPSKLPSLVALVGKPEDDLAGVPGVDVEVAAGWLSTRDGVAGILADLDKLEPRSLSAALKANAQHVGRDEVIARLRADVALASPLWAAVDEDMLDGLREFCEDFELESLLAPIDALLGDEEDDEDEDED